jgi:hypothetical protein
MQRKLRWTKEADANFKKLESDAQKSNATRKSSSKTKSSKQEGLLKQVKKALSYLAADTKHKSLHCHEYVSLAHPWDRSQKVWEAYAQNDTPGAYRIFWCYGPKKSELTIIAITPHP